MTLEIKRVLIRNSIRDHRKRGTPAAVEEITRHVFRDAHIQEWFEYGGEPYHFRILQDITSDDESAAADVMNRLRNAVRDTKNLRSWLDFYGFTTDFDETIKPGESYQLHVDEIFEDWYDYRRNNRKYDGTLDFGNTNFRYTGKYSFNGELSFKGFEAHGTFGQLQASDFEVIAIITRLPADESINSEDRNVMTLEGISHNDSISATALFDDLTVKPIFFDNDPYMSDTPVQLHLGTPLDDSVACTLLSDIDVRYDAHDHPSFDDSISTFSLDAAYIDTLDADESLTAEITLSTYTDTVGGFDSDEVDVIYDRDESIGVTVDAGVYTLAASEYQTVAVDDTATLHVDYSPDADTIAVSELGSLAAVQRFSFDGAHSFDGKITFVGQLQSDFEWVDDHYLDNWKALRDELRNTFDETCPTCGASGSYDFAIGNVRLGDPEQFLISDLQLHTCRILCRNCGNIITEYLVESDSWEVFL